MERRVDVLHEGHREQTADAHRCQVRGVERCLVVRDLCVRHGRLALHAWRFPRLVRLFGTQPCRSIGRIGRNSTASGSIPALFATTSPVGRRPGRQQHIVDRLDQHGWHEAVRRPGALGPRGSAFDPCRLATATIAEFITHLESRDRRKRPRDAERGEHLHEPDHGRALAVGEVGWNSTPNSDSCRRCTLRTPAELPLSYPRLAIVP
jgi:hypothetical protein